MNEYLINYPQLQSLRRRVGGFLLSFVCWLMWAYLLIPLVALGDWFLGGRRMTDEMRWFGGDKSLLELLQIYVATLLVLAVLWMSWVLLNRIRKPTQLMSSFKAYSDVDLCKFYSVEVDQLQKSRQSHWVGVYFDGQGRIIRLETDSHS
ncbi:MAG: poly-beta-1,6-N-acetyl-D-glucosamine biosynthesis protein PgaD [Methylococcaceae bacterium]|jgi:poly-beta-1,6-N-acetyl-D-glucosamine biosynthesis protein PgaD